MTFDFILPWPPTVNHYHQPVRMGKSVRIVKGQKAREYEKLVLQEMARLELLNVNLQGPLSVLLVLNPPTKRKYDIDNRTKAVFDGLTAGKFWADDELVSTLQIVKGEVVSGGSVRVGVKSAV